MRDEREEPQDDLELEITSLDDDKPAGSTSHTFRHFARRHKRPLTAVTVGMVALVFLLVTISTSAVRDLAGKILTGPTVAPTQPFYPGEDLFFVQAEPTWGHLTIDGHAIALLPTVGVSAPVRMGRGQHVLVWSADPFQQQRCTLSVPANYIIDTCIDHVIVQTQPGVMASIIEFRESLNDLAPDRRAALLQAVQEELNIRESTAIVPKGEFYVRAHDDSCLSPRTGETHCYAVATQPLFATLRFHLDANPTSHETCLTPEPGCTFLRESCFTFCSVESSALNAASAWNVLAPVLPLWTFQRQDGSIVERDIPDNMLWDTWTGDLADESLIRMQITWQNGAWGVDLPQSMSSTSPVTLNPVCEAAQNVVGIQDPPADSFGDPFYLQWHYASGIVPASGCLGAGFSRQAAGSVNPTSYTLSGPAYCLLRFGVLLAVNAKAHHFWPYLPMADTYEQNLAQQLAQGINNDA